VEHSGQILLALGGIFMLSLVTDLIGRRTFLPRVTLLLMVGMAIGPHAFDLIPDVLLNHFDLVADVALLMIGFLLGGKLTRRALRDTGTLVFCVSLYAALGAAVLVSMALWAIGVAPGAALLLGCIAAATDPMATVDTAMEMERQGPFAKLLLSIVALDDAWALILFSIGLTLVSTLYGIAESQFSLWGAGIDIFGALLLGVIIGFPGAWLTGRLRQGQPMLTEALALVFVCGGLALWLDLSFLLAAMAMGMTVTNFAKHHDYPFHAIEDIEWPFLVIFFILAGATFEFPSVLALGAVSIVYIIARIFGKWWGGWLGARAAHADGVTRTWVGPALLPQAGAAMGMGLVAASALPEYSTILMTVVISTSVLFELVGPIVTRVALRKADRY